MKLNDLCLEANRTSVDKGFWNNSRSFLECAALMHSELSEAVEEFRVGRIYDVVDGKPEGVAAELADVLIRIFDYCGATGIDLDHVVRAKMDYNKTRPYLHGKKA